MVGNDTDAGRRATIETTAVRCGRCGTSAVSSYHDDDSCGGLVVRVGDEWRCAGCGVGIRPAATCPNCGADDAAAAAEVGVDLRPSVATPRVETALSRGVADLLGRRLPTERTLAALARTHSHDAVEGRFFGGDDGPELGDRLEAAPVAVGSYRSQELRMRPDAREAAGMAEELLAEFGGDLPVGGDDEWTHLAVGAALDPRGGVHATLLFAELVATDWDPDALEAAVHEAVNERRRAHGLSTLSFDHHLAGVARTHSRDMATREFFDHENPEGESASDRYRRADYPPRPSGENIARRYPAHGASEADVAAGVVEGWMNSPGHRENILEDGWDAEGIGVYPADDGAVLVTQNFS